MSRQKSQNKTDDTERSERSPSPVRAYLEALQVHRERIISTSKPRPDEWASNERLDAWDGAVNDPDCDVEIARLRGLAIAYARLLPVDLRDYWLERLDKTKQAHEELLLAANNFGRRAKRYFLSGHLALSWMVRCAPNLPEDIQIAAVAFGERDEDHRKRVGEALLEWVALEDHAKSKILPPVLEIREKTVFVNGEAIPLGMTETSADNALTFLTAVISARGNWISSNEINSQEKMKSNGTPGVRWDRVYRTLPDNIKTHIESVPGKGSRMLIRNTGVGSP